MKKIINLIAAGALLFAGQTMAADKLDPNKPGYINVPAITTNFESGVKGKIHFLKVEFYIAVDAETNMPEVEYYMPEIRDSIVRMLNSQYKDDIDEVNERALLAQKGKDLIDQILIHETGESHVTDLVFSFFVIQT